MKLEAALDPLGLGGRQQHRDVVAALGVAGGEDLAGRRLAQHPLQRLVTGAPQIGGDADPVDVHVDAERRRRRMIGQPPLLPADLGQDMPWPPNSFGTFIAR